MQLCTTNSKRPKHHVYTAVNQVLYCSDIQKEMLILLGSETPDPDKEQNFKNCASNNFALKVNQPYH